MNILVTGATGFVGKWLVDELLDQEDNITVIVRNKAKLAEEWKHSLHIIETPLEQVFKLEQNDFPDGKIDILFHMAWGGVSGQKRMDSRIQVQNVQYTVEILELAKRLHCRRFVNAGSIMEYEALQYVSAKNARPGMGKMYGAAKAAANFVAKSMAINEGMEYINLIISNIYGAGEHSERFLNTTLRKMLNHERIPLTYGVQLYDFIYGTDAAKAMVLVGKKGEKNSEYYIGNKMQYPLKQFVIRMKEIVGSSSELMFGKVPFQGIMLKYDEFDTGKIEQLGFKPEIDFEKGVQLTRDWIVEERRSVDVKPFFL